MAGKKPYSREFSNYLNSLQSKRDPTKKRYNPLINKKMANVPVLDKEGYIRENGIDREDQTLRKKYGEDAFNRRIGSTITKNLADMKQYGVRLPKGRKETEEERAARLKRTKGARK